MSGWDWIVLIASLVFIVTYGVWKGRKQKTLQAYLLANRDMRWWTVAISVMATQASAITFISTPGQAYADGMRFIQFYLGLPIAMIILCITAVPLYHRLNVYTAYEYLENRFDGKTRTLAAFLFLIQRGLGAGLTIYAPSILLSLVLGWDIHLTNLVMGGLVIIYTTTGGARAVSWTQFHQMVIIAAGMISAFVVMIWTMPSSVSLSDGLRVAGELGKMNTLDWHWDWDNRYTVWSGLIGGLFLQLSYFGTDQSQVGRYLTGASVAQSRLGLLTNGLLKIPMQLVILMLGVMVFVLFQFVQPPIFFNSAAVEQVKRSAAAPAFQTLVDEYASAFKDRQTAAEKYVQALDDRDAAVVQQAANELRSADARSNAIRSSAVALITGQDPSINPSDTNYVFLSFVLRFLPIGLIGLVLAAIFAASMSSTSAELNALASTTVIDVYKRRLDPNASDARSVLVGKLATLFWGVFAIAFAEFANRLGSLIEAVNILGSLFYGTILGIFLAGFYFKRIRGASVFWAAIVSEAVVIGCFFWTDISFLWYNVIGCLLVIALGLGWELLSQQKTPPERGL